MKQFLMVLAFGAVALVGCTGPQGATGPMGPSGATGNPTYTYNQNFDGLGYSLGSQWAFTNGGAGSLSGSLDTSTFVSAGKSMKITGGSGVNGAAYTQTGVVPYLTTYKDYYMAFDWDPSGTAIASVKVEAVLVNNNTVLADLGFAVGSPNTFYVYNAGVPVTIDTVSSTPYFHHIQLVYHISTQLSDYYIDNVLVTQGVNTGKSYTISGTPVTWAGFVFPASLGTSDFFNIDDFQLFHY
jgi:hypothetical protein